VTHLWNNSWAAVDVTTRAINRNKAIQDELDRQKGKDQPNK